jgi:hypothetical protein
MAKRRPNPEKFYSLIDDGWSGTAAAIEAGYSRRTARQIAYALKAKRPAREAAEEPTFASRADVEAWWDSGHCARLSLPEWLAAGKPQAQRDVGAISREIPPAQNDTTLPQIDEIRYPPATLVDSKGLTNAPQNLSPAPLAPPNDAAPPSLAGPQNVTGDPFNRPDYPVDPSASWGQFEQQREEEAATRRWLIAQIQEGPHE